MERSRRREYGEREERGWREAREDPFVDEGDWRTRQYGSPHDQRGEERYGRYPEQQRGYERGYARGGRDWEDRREGGGSESYRPAREQGGYYEKQQSADYRGEFRGGYEGSENMGEGEYDQERRYREGPRESERYERPRSQRGSAFPHAGSYTGERRGWGPERSEFEGRRGSTSRRSPRAPYYSGEEMNPNRPAFRGGEPESGEYPQAGWAPREGRRLWRENEERRAGGWGPQPQYGFAGQERGDWESESRGRDRSRGQDEEREYEEWLSEHRDDPRETEGERQLEGLQPQHARHHSDRRHEEEYSTSEYEQPRSQRRTSPSGDRGEARAGRNPRARTSSGSRTAQASSGRGARRMREKVAED